MDAPPQVSRSVRLVTAWLAVLLALGLWQGYGVWLFGGRDAG
jgi:hypothetical protein